MPRYEYRCRACGDTFDMHRPMSEASAKAACPAGHDDTVKLLSTVALGGRSPATGGQSPIQAQPSSGGCCGGGCGCS